MKNKIKEILRSKTFLTGLSFLTLISVIFNLVLLLQVVELDDKLNQTEIEDYTTENIEEYRLQLSSLKRKNEKLEDELKNSIEKNDEKTEGGNNEKVKDDNKPNVVIDQNINRRTELVSFVREFTDIFLSRGNDKDLKRREQLEAYLEKNILDLFIPEGDDGLLTFEIEHGDSEDVLGENYQYNVEVIDQSIYVDDESLDSENINVLVQASIETILNDSSPSKEKIILDIRIENKEDNLKINDVHVRPMN